LRRLFFVREELAALRRVAALAFASLEGRRVVRFVVEGSGGLLEGPSGGCRGRL
jgi:hypothetical protein